MYGLITSRSRAFAVILLAVTPPTFAQTSDTGATVTLTNAAQIRQLSLDEAARGYRARIRGVVTYYDADNHLAFVQDPTAGTYVDPTWRIVEPVDFTGPIEVGMEVELVGGTRPGRFAPFLSEQPFTKILGRVNSMPVPQQPLRGQLLEPTFHSQWIQLEAFVRNVERDGDRLRLKLTYGPQQFDAFVSGDWTNGPPPVGLIQSDVRIRGVYGSVFNDRRQLVGMRLLVPSLEHVEIMDPGMSVAFRQPPRRISEIMQFKPHETERIHIEGMVLLQRPGKGFYLRGEDGAIWVGSDHDGELESGQKVSVVGFPRAGELRPILQDAVVKPLEIGEPPEPVLVRTERVMTSAIDGDLVRTEAQLVDLLKPADDSLLLLQAGGFTFHARLLRNDPGAEPLQRGSLLRLTGICVMQGTVDFEPSGETDNLLRSFSRPVTFDLILRDRADIEVLQLPPWWTAERIRNAVFALIGLAALVGLWGGMLRRKVSQQTALIAERIELERIAEERARIARELHDTLEQELVGITMQLDTAVSRLENHPDRARQSLDRARAMIRHSQSEARQSVWDLRAANLASTRLDDALRELILPLQQSEGPIIKVAADIEDSLPFDGVAKNHILRIAQESVTNALKHAQASCVRVHLERDARSLNLLVSDDGAGFDVAGQRDVNGHFGLIGLRERAGKLNAQIKLDSQPGAGTTISLTVPLSQTAT